MVINSLYMDGSLHIYWGRVLVEQCRQFTHRYLVLTDKLTNLEHVFDV